MATRFRSTSEAVTVGFVVNALFGFVGGWFITYGGDPHRLSFALRFGLLLGLFAASSEYRRSVGRWTSIKHEIISVAIIVLLVVAVSRGLRSYF